MMVEKLSGTVQLRYIPGIRWLLVMLLAVIVCLGFSSPVWSLSLLEVEAVASINRISIIMNGIIRIAAIAAGVCIVWLGHNTMIRGIKGEFEFEGQFGKLKGSTPGLLFVLLGSLVIGWSLQTTASGEFGTKDESQTTVSSNNSTERISDTRPPFMKDKVIKGDKENANSASE